MRRYDREEVRAVQFDEGLYDTGFQAAPRGGAGLRERAVTVDARVAWTDTGVDDLRDHRRDTAPGSRKSKAAISALFRISRYPSLIAGWFQLLPSIAG